MTTEVRFRGGTAAANDAFTGAAREVTVDTTRHSLRIHDGLTPGGHAVDEGLLRFNDEQDLTPDEQARGQINIGALVRVATFASLAAFPWPIDRVKIAEYAAGSGKGGAVYKHVTMEPAHPLKQQRLAGGWWELDVLEINVLQAGCSGSGTVDDYAPVLAALDYAAAKGRCAVYFPAGDYRMSQAAVKTVTARSITLRGDGADISRIIAAAGNTTGCIDMQLGNNWFSTVNVSDLGFYATEQNAGVALRVAAGAGGLQIRRMSTFRDVVVRPLPGVGSNNGQGCFNKGIVAPGLWYPLFDNVVVTGPFDGVNLDTPSENDILMDVAIDVTASYSPKFISCHVQSCRDAIHSLAELDGAPHGAESFSLTSTILLCIRGITIERTLAIEPKVQLNGGHIAHSEYAVKANRMRFVYSKNFLIFCQSLPHSPPILQDFLFVNSANIEVSGVQFGQGIGTETSRRNIVLDGCENAIVDGNIFAGGALYALEAKANCAGKIVFGFDNIVSANITGTGSPGVANAVLDPGGKVYIETTPTNPNGRTWSFGAGNLAPTLRTDFTAIPAANAQIGRHEAYAKDSAGASVVYGMRQSRAVSNAAGAHRGEERTWLTEGGGLKLESTLGNGLAMSTLPTQGLGTVNATGFYVSNTKVVGAQRPAIANATDAASTQARLNDVLAALRTHGLIGT